MAEGLAMISRVLREVKAHVTQNGTALPLTDINRWACAGTNERGVCDHQGREGISLTFLGT